MASVTNNHKTALGLPDGTILPPGTATNVPNWDDLKDNAVLKAWQEKKILSVDDKSIPAAEEKEQIRARLDELGVEYDKRAGVDKLRTALAEAEKAAAGEG